MLLILTNQQFEAETWKENWGVFLSAAFEIHVKIAAFGSMKGSELYSFLSSRLLSDFSSERKKNNKEGEGT